MSEDHKNMSSSLSWTVLFSRVGGQSAGAQPCAPAPPMADHGALCPAGPRSDTQCFPLSLKINLFPVSGSSQKSSSLPGTFFALSLSFGSLLDGTGPGRPLMAAPSARALLLGSRRVRPWPLCEHVPTGRLWAYGPAPRCAVIPKDQACLVTTVYTPLHLRGALLHLCWLNE